MVVMQWSSQFQQQTKKSPYVVQTVGAFSLHAEGLLLRGVDHLVDHLDGQTGEACLVSRSAQ